MAKKPPKRNEREGVDLRGRTPLHYAAANGDDEEVLRLLDAGADAKAKDDSGWTPLHFATQANSASVAFRHGASLIHWRLLLASKSNGPVSLGCFE